jgi:hypothetical protein
METPDPVLERVSPVLAVVPGVVAVVLGGSRATGAAHSASGGCLSAFTPSPDVAPNDVYAWRWTIDTILDAQKKASRWDATFPMTARP